MHVSDVIFKCKEDVELTVILSAGAMLIFSVSFQIDQMERTPTSASHIIKYIVKI